MTTSQVNRFREKALNYAISCIVMKLIDVIEEDDYYLARVEDPYTRKYHRVAIRKTPEISKKVENAIKDLEWRSNGGEFPSSLPL
jgi:hypothetical protein